MNLKGLNIVCYTICIICIVTGVLFALSLIWGDPESESVWKSLVTVGVLFLASALTLGINKMIADRIGGNGG